MTSMDGWMDGCFLDCGVNPQFPRGKREKREKFKLGVSEDLRGELGPTNRRL